MSSPKQGGNPEDILGQGAGEGAWGGGRSAEADYASEYRLQVMDPSGQSYLYPVRGDLSIGSAPNNRIVLDDPEVSPQHLTISTDGRQFWFQDLNSSNGTRIRGEYVNEGWLTGGEEIRLGESRLFFLAPDVAAPPELEDLDRMMKEAEEKSINVDFDFDEGAIAESPQPKKRVSNPWLLLVFGIYLLEVAVLVGGGYFFTRTFFSVPVVQEQREVALSQAYHRVLQIKKLVSQNKWKEANQTLRETLTALPKKSPFREILADRLLQVTKELAALAKLYRARDLYKADRGPEAIALIAKIRKDRYAYSFGQKLHQRIQVEDVQPLLKKVRKMIATGKFSVARRGLEKLFMYNPNMNAAVDLQQKLEQKDPEGSRAARAAAQAKFGKGFNLFKQGKHGAAIVYFRDLEKTASGLMKRKAGMYKRQVQAFVGTLKRGLKASRSGQHAKAISLLLRADSMSKSLGANNRARYARALATSFARQGKAAHARKKYSTAYRLYRRALSFHSGLGLARRGLSSLHRKATYLYKQALVLKGVDDGEARRLLRKVMSMISSSSRLYRKARQKMR